VWFPFAYGDYSHIRGTYRFCRSEPARIVPDRILPDPHASRCAGLSRVLRPWLDGFSKKPLNSPQCRGRSADARLAKSLLLRRWTLILACFPQAGARLSFKTVAAVLVRRSSSRPPTSLVAYPRACAIIDDQSRSPGIASAGRSDRMNHSAACVFTAVGSSRKRMLSSVPLAADHGCCQSYPLLCAMRYFRAEGGAPRVVAKAPFQCVEDSVDSPKRRRFPVG